MMANPLGACQSAPRRQNRGSPAGRRANTRGRYSLAVQRSWRCPSARRCRRPPPDTPAQAGPRPGRAAGAAPHPRHENHRRQGPAEATIFLVFTGLLFRAGGPYAVLKESNRRARPGRRQGSSRSGPQLAETSDLKTEAARHLEEHGIPCLPPASKSPGGFRACGICLAFGRANPAEPVRQTGRGSCSRSARRCLGSFANPLKGALLHTE